MEEHYHTCPICNERWPCFDPNCQDMEPFEVDEMCDGCHMTQADMQLKVWEESQPHGYEFLEYEQI